MKIEIFTKIILNVIFVYLFIEGRDQLCQIRDGQLDSAKGRLTMGWLFPKNYILKNPTNDLLLQFTQSGLEQKIRDQYWSFVHAINCEIEYTPLELNIVWILFKALAIGSGLAFVVFFMELLFGYRKLF